MEKTINRQAILRKTNWGIDIYAHILRRYYPDQTIMTLTGRDCGICRNPLAGGAQTLHIWKEKTDETLKLSDEIAKHKDQFGAIPDGDALHFAALHYHQTGQQLLETLNREMYLHLEASTPSSITPKGPHFSFFKAPITNTQPHKNITINDTYNYITGHYAQKRTSTLRAITDKKKARIYKAAQFDYVTFCGEFSSRHNDKCTAESNLLCLDFDHIPNLEELFHKLRQDQYFETALLFRSPSGDGLKWIIETDKGNHTHADYFRAVAKYIKQTYCTEADPSGKDLARACFLPHDPDAYINPSYR